jgi:hypothetical protein
MGLGRFHAVDRRCGARGKGEQRRLTNSLLAIGRAKANAELLLRQAKLVASDVTILGLPKTGHWYSKSARRKPWTRCGSSSDGAASAMPEVG